MLVAYVIPQGGNIAATFPAIIFFFFLKILFIYLFIFKERGREGEREGKKHKSGFASHVPLTGDLAHNPGMCPDWELNQWPFGLQASPHFTEPHQGSSEFLKRIYQAYRKHTDADQQAPENVQW